MSTLLRVATIALLLSAPLCLAAETVTGRREGAIQIPGCEFLLIVDLDQPGGKNWAGSIIIQGPAKFQGTLGYGGVLRGSYFGSTDGNLYALESINFAESKPPGRGIQSARLGPRPRFTSIQSTKPSTS